MYDKILRHRHAIEAHLGVALNCDHHGGRDQRILNFDHATSSLIISSAKEKDLDKAYNIISRTFQLEDAAAGELGLTGLTSESLIAKMASVELEHDTNEAAGAVTMKKLPLGTAA